MATSPYPSFYPTTTPTSAPAASCFSSPVQLATTATAPFPFFPTSAPTYGSFPAPAYGFPSPPSATTNHHPFPYTTPAFPHVATYPYPPPATGFSPAPVYFPSPIPTQFDPNWPPPAPDPNPLHSQLPPGVPLHPLPLGTSALPANDPSSYPTRSTSVHLVVRATPKVTTSTSPADPSYCKVACVPVDKELPRARSPSTRTTPNQEFCLRRSHTSSKTSTRRPPITSPRSLRSEARSMCKLPDACSTVRPEMEPVLSASADAQNKQNTTSAPSAVYTRGSFSGTTAASPLLGSTSPASIFGNTTISSPAAYQSTTASIQDGTEHSYFTLPADYPLERSAPEPVFDVYDDKSDDCSEIVEVFVGTLEQQTFEEEKQERDQLAKRLHKAHENAFSEDTPRQVSIVYGHLLDGCSNEFVQVITGTPKQQTYDEEQNESCQTPKYFSKPIVCPKIAADFTKLQCTVNNCEMSHILDGNFGAKGTLNFYSAIMWAFGLGWTEENAATVQFGFQLCTPPVTKWSSLERVKLPLDSIKTQHPSQPSILATHASVLAAIFEKLHVTSSMR